MIYMDVDIYNELKQIEDRIFDIDGTLVTNDIIDGIWLILHSYLKTVTPITPDDK